MSLKQDLKLELEDYLRGFSTKVEKYLNVIMCDDDYVTCDDCGHEIYVAYSSADIEPVEMAENVFSIIHDHIHTQEDLKILADAGDIARQLLNPTPTNTQHKQFNDAMKGMK